MLHENHIKTQQEVAAEQKHLCVSEAIIISNGDPITCNELFGGPSNWYLILMDLAVPVYIYIQLTFLQIYLANTNRFPFNVINWAGETLNLKKWNKCKCFLLSKIRCRSSHFC